MQGNMYDYHVTEDYALRVNEAGGHIFLHMDMVNWSKSALKEIRERVDLLAKDFEEQGYVAVFATTDEDKVVKFWRMVRPIDELNKFGPHDEYYLAAWYLEQEETDGN